MKIGSTNISSFRLGSATPSKVYLGATQVWSDAPAAPPGAIATVTATASATSQSAADLSWSAPADNGSAITGYNVYRSTDAGATFTLVANTANTTYEYIEAYRGGEGRSFNVRAVNAGGEGPNASAYGSANLSDSPPSAPTGVTATALADFDLRVAFTAPAFTGNQDITDYEIGYQRPASAEIFTSTFGDLDGDYTIYLTSMESNNAYDVRVRAINSVGNGEWSSVVTSPVIGDVPNASPYTSPAASTVNQGAVTLSIEVPSGYGPAVTSYSVQCDLDGSFSSPISTETYTDQPGSGTFSREITGLAGSVLHYFRVRFVNAIGNGAWSSSSNTYASSTPPGQVTGFSVTPNYSQEKWDLNWTVPGTGGSAITGYELQEDSTNAFSAPGIYYPSPGSSYQSTPYDQNQTRYFRIRAINALGNGAWSSTTSSSYNTIISLSIGSGGSGGTGDNNGASGGQTTLSFENMTMTANGGGGGAGGSGGAAGSATGDMGSYTASGGSGGEGGPGDTGGGGGGGLNGNNGYQQGAGPGGFGSGGGGWGAQSADFNDLFSRLSSLSIPSASPGQGASSNDPSEVGGSATGCGCGGGGAGYYGQDGGAGLYGGGGGGAASEGESRTGGAGGAGCVVLEFVTPSGTTQHIVTTGSSYTAPSNATTIRAWVVGGGGGGGGASSGRGASGGGGAGGIAYYQWTR